MRKDPTPAEDKAWQTLRQFRGYGFPVRRQHPIEGLIVDFAIVKVNLVIEVDGGIHRLPDVLARDRAREAKLRAAGWRVVRISNEQAFDSESLFVLVAQQIGLEA